MCRRGGILPHVLPLEVLVVSVDIRAAGQFYVRDPRRATNSNAGASNDHECHIIRSGCHGEDPHGASGTCLPHVCR